MPKLRKFLESKDAFTLIEVLIALSILAVVTIVAIPNFRKFSAGQDVTNAASNVINILRRAQSNAIANLRCSYDVGTSPNTIPVPAYSFDVHFTPTQIITSTWCVNDDGTTLDYSLAPKLIASSFDNTSGYVDSGRVSPVYITGGTITKNGQTYAITCPVTSGSVKFKGSQVYYTCNPSPSAGLTDYCLLPSTTVITTNCPYISPNYIMVLQDDRNTNVDVVVRITPTGVIDELD